MTRRIRTFIRQTFCRHRWDSRLTILDKYYDSAFCTKCGKWKTLWSGTALEWREKHGATPKEGAEAADPAPESNRRPDRVRKWERSELRYAMDLYDRRGRRLDLLQLAQRHMRDPERTVVCDVLANGQLLPDPHGSRYGFITTGMEHLGGCGQPGGGGERPGVTGTYGPNDDGYLCDMIRAAARQLVLSSELWSEGHYPHSNAKVMPPDHPIAVALLALSELDSRICRYANEPYRPELFLPYVPSEQARTRWDRHGLAGVDGIIADPGVAEDSKLSSSE